MFLNSCNCDKTLFHAAYPNYTESGKNVHIESYQKMNKAFNEHMGVYSTLKDKHFAIISGHTKLANGNVVPHVLLYYTVPYNKVECLFFSSEEAARKEAAELYCYQEHTNILEDLKN